MTPRRVGDDNVADQVHLIRVFAYGAWLGIIGMIVGVLVGGRYGYDPFLSALSGFMSGMVLSGLITLVLSGGAGGLAGRLYMPGRSSMPPSRQYSLGDSLVARGRFDDAAAEFERAAGCYPDDPDPPLRLARLLRDSMQRPEDSLRWFRNAIARRGCDSGVQALAIREIAEICKHRLRQPERALPDLARLADTQAGTPAADWASLEMQDIRRAMRARDFDP
ncbi:MAG: hypothetical protein WD054_05280 [Gemmatimonadota bacterium]